MVNFGLNSASILGIFLAVAGAGLYFLRSVRPELSRDHDIFFAAVGLLCGLILLFQGWRLDPILQFGQFLLTGAAIWFAVETVRLRSVTTEQARRGSPIVEDRPVSNSYSFQAELEALEPYEEDQYEPKRRLRGSDYQRSSRSGYESEEPRRRTRRPPDSYGSERTAPKRRPRPSSTSAYDPYNDEWNEPSDSWQEKPQTSRTSRPRRPDGDVETPETASRPPKKRRPRPPSEEGSYRQRPEATPVDYVDYQPMDESTQEGSDWDQASQPERKPKDPKPNYNEDNPNRFDY